MEPISDSLAVFLQRVTTNHNASTEPVRRSPLLSKRRLDDGPIAGVVVGVVVFCALLCFCLYPIVVGKLRRRRHRKLQRGQHAQTDPEAAVAANAPPVTRHDDDDRRLSSTDSVKPSGSFSRGDLAQPGSRDLSHPSQPPYTVQQYSSWGSQMIDGSAEGPDGQGSRNDLAHHVGDGQVTEFPAYEGGVYYPGADPSEPKGANADYYSPTIPSEAFGMYDMPPPTSQPESPNTRVRGSSLRNSVKDLLRRASGRNGTLSSTGTGDAEGSFAPDGTPLQNMLPGQDPTASPPQLSPRSTGLSSDSRALDRGVPEDGYSPPADRSYKYSPPVNPGPGTVNPMDIMPASSEPERWHRTDHDLYMATHPPPSTSASPTTAPTAQFSQMTDSHSPNTDAQAPIPFHAQEPVRHDTDKTIKQEHAAELGLDVEMTDLSQNYLHPEPDPGRHLSYPSDHSTPFPGLASTNPSSHNTPSTQQTDTPSPESSGLASDFRHSVSPAASNPSPRPGGYYACTVPDCGQVFDQPHKLNHHVRYHAKEHRCEYPNCGKGFGTKTHLQRHINDRHLHSKKYHCAISTCEYSRTGGKHFLRKDNWKRHMTRIHQVKDLPEPIEYEMSTGA
ncbi:Zinc finger domain-containing protein [Sarocladium implicatum]|nr:Zinc finger domain-containing protein [Sarocladium implicatum]